MAETPSTMLPLGTALPAFSLPDLDNKTVSAGDFSDARVLVVAFVCPHCPYVKHVRTAFAQLAKDFQPRGIAFVAINSNDADAYPEDDLDGMKREASAAGYSFPYLRDENQEVAKAFHAVCTPDIFVFDRRRHLAYRGQFDSTRPNQGQAATGSDLRQALDALLAGREIHEPQRPSVGCNIKWRPGNAPH